MTDECDLLSDSVFGSSEMSLPLSWSMEW